MKLKDIIKSLTVFLLVTPVDAQTSIIMDQMGYVGNTASYTSAGIQSDRFGTYTELADRVNIVHISGGCYCGSMSTDATFDTSNFANIGAYEFTVYFMAGMTQANPPNNDIYTHMLFELRRSNASGATGFNLQAYT